MSNSYRMKIESTKGAIAEAIAEDATTWEARESLREQLAGLPAGGGE